MFAGRTWRNSEEFVESQIAGFAAFPACSLESAGETLLIQCGRPDTFLPFVKYWRSWMEVAVFFGICEHLATAFMHTLLCHLVQNLGLSIVFFVVRSYSIRSPWRFAERLAARLLISSSDAIKLTAPQARQAEAIQNLKLLHSPRSIFGSGSLIGDACETVCATGSRVCVR